MTEPQQREISEELEQVSKRLASVPQEPIEQSQQEVVEELPHLSDETQQRSEDPQRREEQKKSQKKTKEVVRQLQEQSVASARPLPVPDERRSRRQESPVHVLRQPQLQLPLELDALRRAPASLWPVKLQRLAEQQRSFERKWDHLDLVVPPD